MGFDSPDCFGKISGKPLKSYYTERDAIEAASYVKNKYGNEQVAYKCNNCGYWHLSPANRQTPSRTCSCVDSHGKPKQLYKTREDAEKRRDIIFREQGKDLDVYRCKVSSGWHLTHKK